MKILIGCEFSQVVTKAFRDRGHEAFSCDIVPCDINPDWHLQVDVLSVLDQDWDLAIFHPPCTFLTNAGATWLYNKDKSKNEQRWEDMRAGATFFKQLLNCSIPKICIENPVMHGHAKQIIGAAQSQVIQPWMFGHTEQKATCLWLKNLPLLKPTNIVKEEMMKLAPNERQRLHYLPPSKDRGKLRSITFQGIAEAMANQWS